MSSDANENQSAFVDIIKQYPVLLEKSNIPEIKNKRRKAVEEIKEKLEAGLGVIYNEGQIWKKIQNLKTRLKAKTYRNQTGNKQIKLKGWEQELFKFLQGDSNPTVARLQGAVSAVCLRKGVEDDISTTRSAETDLNEVESGSSEPVLPTSTFKARPSKETPKKNRKRGLVETDETRDLSVTDLQRLVLLEQLQVFRLAKELLLQKRNVQPNQHLLDLDESEENENPIIMSLFPGNT